MALVAFPAQDPIPRSSEELLNCNSAKTTAVIVVHGPDTECLGG
jgi:hypothetical protein